MKAYDWILFDADETLFHFDAFAGLQNMFQQYGVNFSQTDYEAYESINLPLWSEYQKGNITIAHLKKERFRSWAETLQVSEEMLNQAFMHAMIDICKPLDGALTMLNSLRSHMKLGIITNGYVELLHARLERYHLTEYFELLVISEEVGVPKPHPAIFEHALKLMNYPERERVLMVGDTLESDILGGRNAGLHTCWLNREKKSLVENIKPHHEVASLNQLQEWLLNPSS